MQKTHRVRKLITSSLSVAMLAGTVLATVVAVAGSSAGYVSAADKTCGEGVKTSIIECTPDKSQEGAKGSAIWALLIMIINIMTAGVGVLALGGVVYGAVLYTSAGGSSEQIKKARATFLNVAIGVIAFGAMWALLNFLIPGGVF